MLKSILLTSLFFALSFITFSQDKVYVNPPDYIDDGVRISISDFVGQGVVYKFRLTIENTSKTDYYAYEPDKTGFEFENAGTYFANTKKKTLVVGPGLKKWIVIVAKAGQPVPVAKFKLLLNGLYKGKLPNAAMSGEAMALSADDVKVQEYGGLHIDVSKTQQKKTTYTVQSEISVEQMENNITEVILFDPTKLEASAGGSKVTVTSGSEKEELISPRYPTKFKFEVESGASQIDVDWPKAMQKIDLSSFEMSPITITDGIVPVVINTCPSHTANTEGIIKINVSSDVGCFKFFKTGESLTPDNTSKLIFMMPHGNQQVKIIMDNGSLIEKSIYAKDDYKELFYVITEKDGEYNLRYKPSLSIEADKVVHVKEPVDVKASHDVNEILCDPFKGPRDGSVKVKVFNDQRTCFKLKVDGFDVIPTFTQNAVIFLDPGGQRLRFTTPEGLVVEKKVIVPSDYSTIGYRLKEKKDGELSIVYHIGSQKLSEEGEAKRDERMEESKARRDGALAGLDDDSPAGSSSSERNGCYQGAFSAGSTAVKLKITYRGFAVGDNDITIKHGSAVVGTNHTNNNGIVYIKTNKLKSKKIDVYGCNGSKNWSVTGDWVFLDGSNYFHLELLDVVQSVADMMGESVDSIARSWGLE